MQQSPGQSIPLLVIAGPTATGKTELALRVAEAVGGEIISADAFQVYRGLEIGTAQPSAQQQARARFHLVGELPPDQPFTVADFQRRAAEALAEAWSRGALPILCGGTGLYLRAVLRGFRFPPPPEGEAQPVRRRLQEAAERLGAPALHARLREVDPAAAQRLPPGDVRRVIRALEVWELTGQPLSALARVDPAGGLRYNALRYVLACPRELLYRRLDQRVEGMLAAGWLEEVAALRERGWSPQQQALRALGYRELYEVLAGRLALPPAAEAIQLRTRQFAKRQLTWLRREPGFTWLSWSRPEELAAYTEHLTAVADRLRSGD